MNVFAMKIFQIGFMIIIRQMGILKAWRHQLLWVQNMEF